MVVFLVYVYCFTRENSRMKLEVRLKMLLQVSYLINNFNLSAFLVLMLLFAHIVGSKIIAAANIEDSTLRNIIA